MRLLLVEDDTKLGPLLVRVLGSNGYDVRLAPSAGAALRAGIAFDIAIVDWMLPDGDGIGVCTHLRRAEFEGPLLFLTARGEVRDRVRALDLGADDYLTKPFEIEELLARLRAVSRRGPRISTLDAGPIHLDLARRYAFVRGRLLDLSPRELDLLAYLARHVGVAVPKAELVQNVWQADEVVPNVVEVHVSRLRDKLGAEGHMLQTVRGVGYVLRTSP